MSRVLGPDASFDSGSAYTRIGSDSLQVAVLHVGTADGIHSNDAALWSTTAAPVPNAY